MTWRADDLLADARARPSRASRRRGRRAPRAARPSRRRGARTASTGRSTLMTWAALAGRLRALDERRVDERRDRRLEQRVLARSGRTCSRRRRARGRRCRARARSGRAGAARRRRRQPGTAAAPARARFTLATVPGVRMLPARQRERRPERHRVDEAGQQALRIDAGDDDARRRSPRRDSRTTPVARPSRSVTCATRRVRADLAAGRRGWPTRGPPPARRGRPGRRPSGRRRRRRCRPSRPGA